MKRLDRMDFGNRLRRLRNERGLTQQRLADGISTKSFISQLEKGHALPSLDTLFEIADRLDVPVSVLLGEPESTITPAWLIEELERLIAVVSDDSCESCREVRARLFKVLGQSYEQRNRPESALNAYRSATRNLLD